MADEETKALLQELLRGLSALSGKVDELERNQARASQVSSEWICPHRNPLATCLKCWPQLAKDPAAAPGPDFDPRLQKGVTTS